MALKQTKKEIGEIIGVIYGIVVECSNVYSLEENTNMANHNKYMVNLSIIDPTYAPRNKKALPSKTKVSIFAKREYQLPKITHIGDILKIHNVIVLSLYIYIYYSTNYSIIQFN